MSKIVVDANNKRLKLGIKELINYKDLFWVLAYRDYKIRYAQTFLGFLWAFIQPFTTLIILVVVFGKVVKVDTADIPYPLFAICGMTGWTYFSFVMNQSGNSIIGSQDMVKKVYFPRLILPISKALVGFVDYFISFTFILVLLIYYQYTPSLNIIYLPIFIVLTVIASLAIGIWLSALTIRYRDFQHMIPFVVQFGLYATPVAYPVKLVTSNLPEWAVVLYFLNPMAGIVEGYRWSILGGEPPGNYLLISFVITGIILISGLYYFKKVERVMADLV